MTSCAIRYRLDGPGPGAMLVDCGHGLRLVAREGLEGTMPQARLLAMLAERGLRWVPASGEVVVDEAHSPRPDSTASPRPLSA